MGAPSQAYRFQLLVSGRCISASQVASVSRMFAKNCFAIGEATGVAASLSLKEKVIPKTLNINKLQNQLRKNGVLL